MKGDTGITIPFVGKETVIWPLQMGSYRCRIHVGFCFLLLNKTATGPANVGDGDTTNRHLLRPAMENPWKMSIIALELSIITGILVKNVDFPANLSYLNQRDQRVSQLKNAMTIGSVFRPRCSPIRIRCGEPTLQTCGWKWMIFGPTIQKSTWLPLVTGNWYTMVYHPVSSQLEW